MGAYGSPELSPNDNRYDVQPQPIDQNPYQAKGEKSILRAFLWGAIILLILFLTGLLIIAYSSIHLLK
ncbi:MAG: hypothetical protein K0Q85_352 [Caproiciproducens sp.]|jgi:hypothetical protein|nr:hypothetical protein [Caproiciproducens sp.]